MSDESDDTLPSTENSRRSFMKMGALASGALALGGSAVGLGAAQEDDEETTEDDGGTDGDTVLMLHPDAVEDAEITVASDELDWSPIGDGGGATPTEDTPTEDGDGILDGGNETTTTTEDEETTADGGASNYGTYMVEYGFSASHVAPVFVPDDVDLSQDDERQLGEIQEVVEQPGGDGGAINQDGTDDAGQEGEPLYVRVSLEEAGATGVDEETTAETPTEDTPTEDGGILGGGENETTTTEAGDGGILGGGENETTTTEEGGGGIFG